MVNYPTLDEAKKDPRGFHKFLRGLYPEQDIQFDQVRAILADASVQNWPYSGSINHKKCGNSVLLPHCFPVSKIPKHDCEPKVFSEETRRFVNSTGMPIDQEQMTVEPLWEDFGVLETP